MFWNALEILVFAVVVQWFDEHRWTLCRFKSQLFDFTNSGSEPSNPVWGYAGYASTGASSGTPLPFAANASGARRKWMRRSSLAAEAAIVVPWMPWMRWMLDSLGTALRQQKSGSTGM